MRIALDGLHLFGKYSGVHHALARLLVALRSYCAEDELVLFVPKDFAGPPEPDAGLLIRKAFFPGRWRTVRSLWRNLRLQAHAYRARCDVLHGPTYALPSLCSMRSVVTIHDTIALSHPQFATPGSARVQKHQLPRSARVARRVIVPSEAVKAEAVARLKIAAEKVDVIPWGAGDDFRIIEDRELLEDARKEWSLPERFVLFVGTLEPKKNIEGLIKGFFAAKVHKKLPHKLVLAGQMGWGMKNLPRLIRELDAREYILFTDYVPQKALPLLYNLAELFVMPSHVEGFGMPLLEAFACGCPALISAAPALVEVAGGAAAVLPHDEKKPFQPLRETLEELLTHHDQRKAWREKGLARAKEFTWRRTAELTHACYAKALAD